MKDSILENACVFDFFQAIVVLEWLYPDRTPVGRMGLPSREIARICARLTLEFPASEIQEVVLGKEEDPQPRMTVNFMGLTGPLGVLPTSYTELLLERRSAKDFTLREFLDLFNHRIVSLFYRAWEKYRFPVSFRRHEDDTFSQYLSDLIGMGTPGLQQRLAFKDAALLFYSGLFAQHPHSASGLEGILRDYYGVPCHVEQFVGRWVRLGPENETRLGTHNTELGVNAVLGSHIWDRQSKFRACLGPLDLAIFRRLLPCGDGFKPLIQMIRLYAGMEYDFDVQLALKAPQVPRCQLRSSGIEGAHLGWSSWLKIGEFKKDSFDTVLASSI